MGDEVIKVLDHLGKQFGVAIDWSSANILPYLQDLTNRIVKYGIYQNISNITYTILVLVVLIIITRKLYKLANKYCNIYENTGNKNDKEVGKFFTTAFVISICVTIIISIVVMGNTKKCIDNIIELNTIPEKYVIEMVQDQIDEFK